jgi:hypothetical protein
MSECLISFTNLKLKIRTFLRTASMMINSNTRFFNKSLISFRLDSTKIEMRTNDERHSIWFECESSSWRKTMISAKFWYLNDRRLARVDLVLANCLMIANDLMMLRITPYLTTSLVARALTLCRVVPPTNSYSIAREQSSHLIINNLNLNTLTGYEPEVSAFFIKFVSHNSNFFKFSDPNHLIRQLNDVNQSTISCCSQ